MFDKKKKWQAFQEAVRQDDAAQVKLSFVKDRCYDACVLAAENNAPSAFQTCLEESGNFRFKNSWHKDMRLVRELLEIVLKIPEPAPFLIALYETNKKAYDSDVKIKPQEFLSEKTPTEIIQPLLEDDQSLFGKCIDSVGLHSTNKLKFILTFTPKDGSGQAVLNGALIKAAEAGDIDKSRLLLDRDADPNYAAGRALLRATETDKIKLVELLLPKVDLALYGEDIAMQAAEKNVQSEIIDRLETATKAALKSKEEKAQEPVAEYTQEASGEDGYIRLDDHTLGEMQKLPDGSTLTTLFNFTIRQQEKYVTNETGNIFPAKPVNFSELEDGIVDAMHKKFDALAEKAEPEQPRRLLRARNTNSLSA